MTHGRRSILTLLLVGVFLAGSTIAGDEAAVKKPPTRKKAARRRCELIRRAIRPYVAETFERVNTETDLLRGHITHAWKDGNRWRAYVFVAWGDLDKKLKGISKEYYNNWDGYVEVAEGKAWVAAEFAFDDGSPLPGTRLRQMREKAHGLKEAFKEEARQRRDAAKARAGARIKDPDKLQSALIRIDRQFKESVDRFGKRIDAWFQKMRDQFGPREGSGRDALIPDGAANKVTWKSGVVGATDGLLIRLALPDGETTGTIKVGQFTIPFTITPMPEETQEALKKAQAKAKARAKRDRADKAKAAAETDSAETEDAGD